MPSGGLSITGVVALLAGRLAEAARAFAVERGFFFGLAAGFFFALAGFVCGEASESPANREKSAEAARKSRRFNGVSGRFEANEKAVFNDTAPTNG